MKKDGELDAAPAGSPQYTGAIWALADVDLAKLDTKSERISISIPRFVLRKIDTSPRRATRRAAASSPAPRCS